MIKTRAWLIFLRFMAGLALIVLVLGGWALGLRISGNVHSVDDTIVFRSAQLSPEFLARLVQENGIKTIINLRGEHSEDEWYRAELAVSSSQGIQHKSLALSATHEPDDATLKALIKLMREARQPVLIHCEAGADRSGLAAALYRLVIKGDEPSVAAHQLSFRYGHFPWLGSRTGAMDRAFWRVVAAPEQFTSLD